MAKQIEISIPQPCLEDWNKMNPVEQGRHCKACQKTVVDFTSMNDEQLMQFFRKKPANVCGHFFADQLSRQMTIPVKKIPWLRLFFQVSLPAFLLSLKTSAQQTLHRDSIEVAPLNAKQVSILLANQHQRLIQGFVMDSGKHPVPYVTIMVAGTNKGTTSDGNGRFSILVNDKDHFLTVSSVGYESKQTAIPADKNSVEIIVQQQRMMLGGAVVIRSVKKIKKKKVNPVVQAAPLNSMIIFPNPVSLFSMLTLEWKYPVNEDLEVEMYNIQGELMQNENIRIDRPISKVQLQLKLKAAGNYIIRTTGVKTKNISTSQLLVK